MAEENQPSKFVERRGGRAARLQGLKNLFLVLFFLYLFIASIRMMGSGLKLVGKEHSRQVSSAVHEYTSNPFVGLFVGIIITTVFQSSSFTTSLVVTLVAAGQIHVAAAIPIVMGANIGTTVTNSLVSLVHIRRRLEFRRAFGAAVVHDFFNLLSVLVLFPLERFTHVLERTATLMASRFHFQPTAEHTVVARFLGAVGNFLKHFLRESLGLSGTWAGFIMAAVGVALLLFSLIQMVKYMKRLMLARLERFFGRYFFRNAVSALVVGLIVTVCVQSSSVTTSIVVPLAGAGILTVQQIFPYTLGANIGTTVTALIAAAALPAFDEKSAALKAAGLTVAFAHLLFNCFGTLIWWPFRFVPVGMAEAFARVAARRPRFAVVYTLVIFYLIPIVLIIISYLVNH